MTKCQIIVPIKNERDTIIDLYTEIMEQGIAFDLLTFVYDDECDESLSIIASLVERDHRVQALRNFLGKGPGYAIKSGIVHCDNGPIVVVMGDLSDDVAVIPAMLKMWQTGSIIVAPTRVGRRWARPECLRQLIVKSSSILLSLLQSPVIEPTNNFKLYDGAWVKTQSVKSGRSFSIALELCCKALHQKQKITSVQSRWKPRKHGRSNFRTFRWLPGYMRWFSYLCFLLMADRLDEKEY